MICNTIGLTADSFESIYTTGGTEVEEVYGAINYTQPIYAKIREITGTSPLTFTSSVARTLTDYSISGETLQDGTPSPDMPVDVIGCGDRTENLWSLDSTWTNSNVDSRNVFEAYILLLNGDTVVGYELKDISYNGKYFISAVSNVDFSSIRFKHNGLTQDLNIGRIYGDFKANTRYTVSFDVTGYNPKEIGGITISNIMLNTGSTVLPYEPYGYKLPVATTNGTDTVTTPIYIGSEPLHRIGEYADYVDYESGKIVKRIGKYVFTGDENITRSQSGVMTRMYYMINSAMPVSPLYCTHFRQRNTIDGYPDNGHCNFNAISNFIMGVDGTRFETADDFKSYLAAQYATGTPVTVWYVLQEPIEEEPPVPFPELPTLSGINTLSVDTTVKPSAVSITGNIKPDGYGKLVDNNGTYVLDKDGVQLTVHGQGTSN